MLNTMWCYCCFIYDKALKQTFVWGGGGGGGGFNFLSLFCFCVGSLSLSLDLARLISKQCGFFGGLDSNTKRVSIDRQDASCWVYSFGQCPRSPAEGKCSLFLGNVRRRKENHRSPSTDSWQQLTQTWLISLTPHTATQHFGQVRRDQRRAAERTRQNPDILLLV